MMKIKIYIQRVVFFSLFSFCSMTMYSQLVLDVLQPGNIIGFPFPEPEPLPSGAFLYVPNTGSATSIRAKSDVQFSFNYKIKSSADWDFDIKNFNVAFSPLPHLYATANYLQVENDGSIRFFDSKMMQGDFGIGGYYLKELKDVFKKKNIFNKTANWMMPQKGILVNGLLGYSRGKITHQLTHDIGHGKFTLNKFYGQIGFDYQARIWGVAASTKFGILNYGTTYLEARAPRDLTDPIVLLRKKKNYKFREFEVRAYLGIRYGQLFWSIVNAKTEKKLKDFVLSNYQSVGVLLDFQEIFKKKVKNEK